MINIKDARNYQILFLSIFLFLGINNRDWTLTSPLIAILFLSCILTQIFLSNIVKSIHEKNQEQFLINPWYSPKHLKYFISNSSWQSAVITTLGLCLLLRSNDPFTLVLAGCLAIASKFLFRFHHKHFFNPANFGIIIALILTDDAWISPGQWGNDWWYLILFIATGLMVLKKVGRWDTTAVFLATYLGLEAIRNHWLGWSLDVTLHQSMSGSLLVFAFFMLTDPRSIPNSNKSRIIWALFIAILSFILKEYFYINNAIFWSLFILSPLTIYLDYVWQMPRFRWVSPNV